MLQGWRTHTHTQSRYSSALVEHKRQFWGVRAYAFYIVTQIVLLLMEHTAHIFHSFIHMEWYSNTSFSQNHTGFSAKLPINNASFTIFIPHSVWAYYFVN